MNWTEEEQMTDDVIPIARGREPLWAGPHLPLREAILEAIREYALEEKSDDEDDERAKLAIEVLVCVKRTSLKGASVRRIEQLRL
jgi:hypothetical protein